MTDERAIVVGGGIGGLSAALALQRRGIPVTVFEQAPELKEVGAGIQVWVNGMKAAHEIGVGDSIRAASGQMEMMHFRSWRGAELMRAPVGEVAARTGAPHPRMIRRPELLRCLAERLAPEVVRLGKACVGFEQDDDGVTVRFADGSEERGAVLIAADGIKSVCRQQAFGEVKLRYAGYQYLRATLPYEEPSFARNTFTFTFGPGDRFGSGDVGAGWIYWFAVIVTPEGANDGDEGRKGELQRRFRHFAGSVPHIIDSTSEELILRNDIRDIEPLPRWVSGRMTLMGDAAHAPTPNLGRGASEAMEDGWQLGEALATVSTLKDRRQVTAALETFEARRREKTAKIQTMAWRIGATANWSNPVSWRFREQLMRAVIGKQLRKDNDAEFAEYALTPG